MYYFAKLLETNMKALVSMYKIYSYPSYLDNIVVNLKNTKTAKRTKLILITLIKTEGPSLGSLLWCSKDIPTFLVYLAVLF